MATYYVSNIGCDSFDGSSPLTAWKSIKKVNEAIRGGDTVLFRCGDTFFGQILPPANNESDERTVYGSFGDGPKPTVSEYKTALSHSWENFGNGVWRIDLKNTENFTGNVTELDTNVGFLKVDGVIRPHKKFALDKLEKQWDFYNDDRFLYVKADDAPYLLAKEIMLACNIICMRFADRLLVDGLSFIGSGAHGISGTVKRATVRNCEFHELGGSELLTYFEPGVRYGNGVECWSDSCDVLVESCRFSGIYDVAMTMQGDNVSFGWRNITFCNNVVWNCQQAFEIWSDGEKAGTGFKNCVFENNVCIDSGYCWGYEVRPNKLCSSHLLMYSLNCPLCDVTVRNNTFYRARVAPIFKSRGPQTIPDGYCVVGNTFFVRPSEDIVYRYGCSESEYATFYEKIVSKNRIIETAFDERREMSE